MRWVLVLAVVGSAMACRRAAPPPEPPAEPAPVASPAGSTGDRARAPAERPADAVHAASVATAPLDPPTAPPRTPESLPVAEVPPRTAPPPAADKPDNRLYSWVDEDGSVHYGTADDVPPIQRKSARVVDAGVTVVSPEPLGDVPPPAAASAPPPAESAGQPDEPRRRGAQPELDEQGLPIPGTMEDTAATQAAKAAGERQIDPAAVERRRQEELRRMNCKEKDGVWICG